MQVSQITDKTILRAYMQSNIPLFAYALGDLDDRMWTMSTFNGVFQNQRLMGISLVWRGFRIPVFLVFGSQKAIAALTTAPDVPDQIYGMVERRVLPLFEQYFNIEQVERLWRMAVRRHELVPVSQRAGLRRLNTSDIEALNQLFAPEGIELTVEDQLVATTGTHVCAPPERVGTVGYVYTAPSARGKGYATITTAAVARTMFRMGIDLVALNVVQENTAAIRAYQNLGYRIYEPIVAGVANRK